MVIKDRGTPWQRRQLQRLDKLNYVDDDVYFNTIKSGLNNGNRDYYGPNTGDLGNTEVINHIIDYQGPNDILNLEEYYKKYIKWKLSGDESMPSELRGGNHKKSKKKKSKKKKSKKRKSNKRKSKKKK